MTARQLALRAHGLRKAYRIYARPADPLLELLGRGKRHAERVALDRIDLELARGEIVGILGRNGAGKSTLLKIIAGTLERTAGELDVHGRITAILELGTGFHPDYTGRENIFMGGICLGMSRAEVESKVDEIIDFSELREVIDQPFKTYSTGMQARLTFSTAISVEPDILIVDEALSVGDARFQMKCFAWFQRLKQRNATVLLVSHDTNTITTFCDRALILENGRVYAEGAPKAMTVIYHNLLFGTVPQPPAAATAPALAPEVAPASRPAPAAATVSAAPPPRTIGARYGSREVELIDWGLCDPDGNALRLVSSGASCRFWMRAACRRTIDEVSFGFSIKDRRGTVVWGITNMSQDKKPQRVSKGDVLSVTCDCTMWLAAGEFSVTIGFAYLEDGMKLDQIEDAMLFTVIGPGNIYTTSTVNLDSTMAVTCVCAPVEAT